MAPPRPSAVGADVGERVSSASASSSRVSSGPAEILVHLLSEGESIVWELEARLRKAKTKGRLSHHVMAHLIGPEGVFQVTGKRISTSSLPKLSKEELSTLSFLKKTRGKKMLPAFYNVKALKEVWGS